MVSEVVNIQITLNRVNQFLSEPELDKFDPVHPRSDNHIIGFKDGEFCHQGGGTELPDTDSSSESLPLLTEIERPHDSNFVLKKLNIQFPIGKLTTIAGPTGSGKTSLLCALLGELKRISGKYYLPEDHLAPESTARKSGIAYVPQTAWLMNATIRDNILFGEVYDEKRYDKVVTACALKRDLETLEGGDLTEIGEKGVNLSGGQKQRISLARAAYSRAPVVLLDDPLSAVDAPTARHLFNRCILGIFKGRTILLVSHTIGLVISKSDYVVVMKNGEVLSQGTPEQVIADPLAHNIVAANTELASEYQYEKEETFERKVGSQLTEQEGKATGRVKWATYKAYLMACGGLIFVFAVLFAFSFQIGADYLNNWWIEVWTDSVNRPPAVTLFDGPRSNIHSKVERVYQYATSKVSLSNQSSQDQATLYYISIFGAIGLIELVSLQVRVVIQFLGGLNASRKLHSALLNAVMGSPLRFFEITPVGRYFLALT